jgi:hypothetical protein
MSKEEDFLSKIGAPARRVFELHGLTTLEKVSKRSEKELLSLHGVGPKAIRLLQPFLKARGLNLAEDEK